jgi:ATPase subunit of ABC transporter with duplicated ATPase domains
MSFIVVTSLGWNRPDGTNLFNNISFACNLDKTGLTGNNGTGKSILAKIITGTLPASEGHIETGGVISYLPQNMEAFTGSTIAGLFGITERCAALHNILAGHGTEADYLTLNDDWELEERLHHALQSTGVDYLSPLRQFSTLSGGEQIRCVFASLLYNKPDFLILDEPTNHLDEHMRRFVYSFVREFKGGVLVISHDRELLRQMDRIIELTPVEAKVYGGNYDFYEEQKAIECAALEDELSNAVSRLDKRIGEMRTAVRKQEQRTKNAAKNARGQNIPKSVLHKYQGRSEQTAAILKKTHERRVEDGKETVAEIRNKLPVDRRMVLDFTNTKTPGAKKIVLFENVQVKPDGEHLLWSSPVSFSLLGNDRLHLRGANGSGKSTLLKLITGELQPDSGNIFLGVSSVAFLDQNVSLLDNTKTILENILSFANNSLSESELRIRLARLLFFNDDVYKNVAILSGGERMRLGLACLFAKAEPPGLILLDEPTNNLDLKSIQQMSKMLNEYGGSLIVVSHDRDFINDLQVNQDLILQRE